MIEFIFLLYIVVSFMVLSDWWVGGLTLKNLGDSEARTIIEVVVFFPAFVILIIVNGLEWAITKAITRKGEGNV